MKKVFRKTDSPPAAASLMGVFSCGVLIAALAAVPMFFGSCRKMENRESLAIRMAENEGEAENNERIVELKAEIRSVDRQVEKTIEAVKHKGTYWRLLGLKYMDYSMWGEASAAFDKAVEIYPDSASLLYNRALTAGQMALSSDTPEQRLLNLNKAESGYRRAISVNPSYSPPHYALSVLLVFELNRPLEAAPFLQDYLKIERSNINGRFLLARVYLTAGMKSDAMSLYEEIMDLARDKSDVVKAEELYNRVAGGENGS